MKKLILTFIAAVTAFSMQAQNITPGLGDHEQVTNEPEHGGCCMGGGCMSGWVIDVNLMGGALNQQYTSNNPAASYLNPVNTNISNLQFDQGMSYGAEVQGGYFFGKHRHFGVGLGLTYLYQTGNLAVNNYHVEYQALDNFGNVFRQEVTANGPIKESLGMSSFNVPVLFKYQTDPTKKVGFTLDAGLLFNLHVQNYYKTNASFDYEAVYKYTGSQGDVTTVYDNSPVPGPSDLLITKAQYVSTHTSANIQDYFNTLRNEGYSVGLGQKPASDKGSMSYTSGSVGFLIRPAVSFRLCSNVQLNVGLYYYYQNFNNTPASNYHITNTASNEYSSMLNTVTNATNSSYGLTAGIRYTFCKGTCEAPPAAADIAPEPVEAPEPIAAAEPEPEETPESPAHVDISTPLLFDLNKVVIKESSIPILEEAVRELRGNRNATLTINGYTDNTGSKDYNKKLSKKRATVVKNYLRKKGVDPKILKTVGHGEGHPASSNRTKEGRMKNRRVIMNMKED